MNARNKAAEYEKKANALFDEWKAKKPQGGIDHGGGVFIRDGIARPEQWFEQDVRPLFFLKEAYGGDEDWDLCGYFMSKDAMPRSTAWRKITQWAYGILNSDIDEAPSYDEMLEETQDEDGIVRFGNEQLEKIAVVNVKKSGGRPTSEDDDLKAYAEYDAEMLARQIEMIDPTVIVCGYTYRYLKIALKDHPKPKRISEWAYEMEINGHSAIVLDYYHPANQFPSLMNYYGLTGVYRQALEALSQREAASDRREAVNASGAWGTCPWRLESGVLTVGAGTGEDTGGVSPWDEYGSDVESVTFETGVVAPNDCSGLFCFLDSIVGIDFSGFDASRVTDMRSMFSRCSGLKTLDLSGLSTSNVTDMSWMFYRCSSLAALNVSSFDTVELQFCSDGFQLIHAD